MPTLFKCLRYMYTLYIYVDRGGPDAWRSSSITKRNINITKRNIRRCKNAWLCTLHKFPMLFCSFRQSSFFMLDILALVCYILATEGRKPDGSPQAKQGRRLISYIGDDANEHSRHHCVTDACSCGCFSGSPDKEITAP